LTTQKRAILFANGEMLPGTTLSPAWLPADLVIAADGGTRHCLALGLRPEVIIGDFDSLEPGLLARLEDEEVTLLRYPAHKDETDLELAFLHALHSDIDEIIVLGALGARWDMTLANLLLPAQPRFSALQVRFFDGNQEISLLRGGQSLALHGQPGDTLSLVPLCGGASGITTQGLEYPLDNEALPFGSPRGVSNVLLGREAQITLSDGLLACMHIRRSPQERGSL